MAPEMVGITQAKKKWKVCKRAEQKAERARLRALKKERERLAQKARTRLSAARFGKQITSGLRHLSLGKKVMTQQQQDQQQQQPITLSQSPPDGFSLPKNEKDLEHKSVNSSKNQNEPSQQPEKPRPTLTELGVEPYGKAIDVFSCGVVLGQLLFHISDEFVLDYPDENSDSLHEHFVRLIDKTEPFLIAYDLLLKMTAPDPRRRITIGDALQHPFFTQDEKKGMILLEERNISDQLRKQGAVMCSGCHKLKLRDEFSHTQIRKKGNRNRLRRCRACIGTSQEVEEEDSS